MNHYLAENKLLNNVSTGLEARDQVIFSDNEKAEESGWSKLHNVEMSADTDLGYTDFSPGDVGRL